MGFEELRRGGAAPTGGDGSYQEGGLRCQLVEDFVADEYAFFGVFYVE